MAISVLHWGEGLKLRFSEKATKFEKKSPTCFDIYTVTSKQVGYFFSNFVAFSECLNLKLLTLLHLLKP